MINVEKFCDNFANANTYLVTSDKIAIIVDPANDLRILKKYLNGKTVKAVFLTHGHYDHFKMLEDVINEYQIPCYLHKKAKMKLFDLVTSYAKDFGASWIPKISDDFFIMVNDNDLIKIDDLVIKVMYTPGHTDCSVCYLLDDLMFSGDTLFKNSVGRTDLLTGSTLKQHLTIEKLKHLKTNYHIYPGHDEETTLFFEQKNNPYFK